MEGSEAVARLRLPLLPVMSAAPDRAAGWGAYAMTAPGLTSVGRTGRPVPAAPTTTSYVMLS